MVWKLIKCIGGLQSAAAVAVADAVAAGKVSSSSGTKADLSLRRLVLDRISEAQPEPELGVRFRFSELDVEGARGPSSWGIEVEVDGGK